VIAGMTGSAALDFIIQIMYGDENYEGAKLNFGWMGIASLLRARTTCKVLSGDDTLNLAKFIWRLIIDAKAPKMDVLVFLLKNQETAKNVTGDYIQPKDLLAGISQALTKLKLIVTPEKASFAATLTEDTSQRIYIDSTSTYRLIASVWKKSTCLTKLRYWLNVDKTLKGLQLFYVQEGKAIESSSSVSSKDGFTDLELAPNENIFKVR